MLNSIYVFYVYALFKVKIYLFIISKNERIYNMNDVQKVFLIKS